MDLYVQTLTGTLFELRVSPFETILSIKGKVQRLEGIPISQQHLIWQSTDLQDDFCLHDYGIKNGATLTLVLAMRDGPINMRRVSAMEEPDMQEIEEYMDANKEEIMDKLCDDKQVTLLIFRDGDQLNFYRVYDPNTESYSPNTTDSISGSSSMYTRSENVIEQLSPEKQNENAQTKDKMENLKKKLEAAKHSKKKKFRPRSIRRTSSKLSQRRSGLVRTPSSTCSSQGRRLIKNTTISPVIPVQQVSTSNIDSLSHKIIHMPNPPVLPPVTRASKSNLNKKLTPTPPPMASAHSHMHTERASASSVTQQQRRKLPSLQDMSDRMARLNQKSREKSDLHLASRSRRRVLKPLNTSDNNSDKSGPLSQHHEQSKRGNEAYKTYNTELDSYTKLLNWVQPPGTTENDSSHTTISSTSITQKKTTPELRLSSKLRSVHLNSKENTTSHHLPPLHPNQTRMPPSLNGKKKKRCTTCAKKLGLATTYQCRCGGKYCSQHRYPETHGCTYDFKSEGRKFLEKNNPVVTASKLPKI